ncbi:MAG: ribosomal L7Ae/L30e/S12e/Gadd45 family protein [Christensenellales bacterium]
MVHDLSRPEKRVVGMKQVLKFAHSAKLDKVFIAKDADEMIISKLTHVCETNKIPYDLMYTMHQIGSACQIDVGSACAAVIKLPD